MAITRAVRRINPLDANKNVATIGVALPLDSTNLFQGIPTTREQVRNQQIAENIEQIGIGVGYQVLGESNKIK